VTAGDLVSAFIPFSGQQIRHRAANVYHEAEFKTECNQLASNVAPTSAATVIGCLESVEHDFNRWKRIDHIVCTTSRFIVRPFMVHPAAWALLLAVGLAQAGVVSYAAWDHLDSPLRSWPNFATSVRDVL
jgi:hypothetical protein